MQFEEALTHKNKISLTPLIDVVFILLMFFMLATKFQHEKQMDIAVYQDGSSQHDEKPHKTILLLLMNEGDYKVNNRVIPQQALLNTIQTYAKSNNEYWFEVRSEPNSQVQQLVNVMDSFQQAGIKNVEIISQSHAN